MICFWLAVEPVKVGPENGPTLLQAEPSPASSATRLS
jgi:hypothetical protein